MDGKQDDKRSLTRIAHHRHVCLNNKMLQYTPVIYHTYNRDVWIVLQPDGDMLMVQRETNANALCQLVWLGMDIPTLAELDAARSKQLSRQTPPQK